MKRLVLRILSVGFEAKLEIARTYCKTVSCTDSRCDTSGKPHCIAWADRQRRLATNLGLEESTGERHDKPRKLGHRSKAKALIPHLHKVDVDFFRLEGRNHL